MADKKISQLTGVTTPLVGTEEVPVVQSGSTKKVSVDNLTAGRDVAANSVTAANLKTSDTAANLDISATTIAAGGSETNLNIGLLPKGTGAVRMQTAATAGVAEVLRLTNPQNSPTTGDGSRIRFQNTTNPSVDRYAAIESYTNDLYGQSTGLRFLTNNLSDVPRTTLDLLPGAGGDVRVSIGNLVIGTAGKGIDFSATSDATGMTSELLDDYEEGTFTPVLTCATPGDLSVTYATQRGVYQIVGNVCHVWINIQTNSVSQTTASGSVRISGLPLTSSLNGVESSMGSLMFQGITKIGYTQFSPQAIWTTSYLQFVASGTGVAASSLAIGEIDTGTNLLNIYVAYIIA